MHDFTSAVFHCAFKGFAFDFAIYSLLWTASVLTRYTDILDVYWAVGFFALSLVYTSTLQQAIHVFTFPTSLLLLYGMLMVWGVRLSGFTLFKQYWSQWKEDHRYASLRQEHGSSYWWRSFFLIMLPTVTLHWLVSLSLLVSSVAAFEWQDTVKNNFAVSLFGLTGFCLWLSGVIIEGVADWQMFRFKQQPKNKDKIMYTGLWGLSRHPNYFGDILLWCGFFVTSLDILLVPVKSPDLHLFMVALSLLSPIAMTWMLTRFTGVKMVEEIVLDHKPGYLLYKKRVPAVVPSLDLRSHFKYRHAVRAAHAVTAAKGGDFVSAEPSVTKVDAAH